ncbi:MAG: DUF86 domain-containing protein [Gammaproteobacteria bacterium]|nr:DUF86 domain-containing protein [Gammaproteobacteria bacterium]
MKACCGRTRKYTLGLSREAFLSQGMVYDATLRNLELLGEAAGHIPEETRALAPDIPWRQIIGMRNILIHGYLGIDDDIIWDIVTNEIEKLLLALEKLETAGSGLESGSRGTEESSGSGE